MLRGRFVYRSCWKSLRLPIRVASCGLGRRPSMGERCWRLGGAVGGFCARGGLGFESRRSLGWIG